MGALEIYVLNVGQADAAIIRTPGDNIIIIDAYNPAKVKYDSPEKRGDFRASCECGRIAPHFAEENPYVS